MESKSVCLEVLFPMAPEDLARVINEGFERFCDEIQHGLERAKVVNIDFMVKYWTRRALTILDDTVKHDFAKDFDYTLKMLEHPPVERARVLLDTQDTDLSCLECGVFDDSDYGASRLAESMLLSLLESKGLGALLSALQEMADDQRMPTPDWYDIRGSLLWADVYFVDKRGNMT